jgi:hypothetical protein
MLRRMDRLPAADLQSALAEIARAIADSLEVRAVWDRVADACRLVVPFDAMGIVRLQPDGSVRAVAAAGGSRRQEPRGPGLPARRVFARVLA